MPWRSTKRGGYFTHAVTRKDKARKSFAVTLLKSLCGVVLSFGVQLLDEFFELGFLFRRKNRANLVAAFLALLLELCIGLLVHGFDFGVMLQQDAVQLLRLIAAQT